MGHEFFQAAPQLLHQAKELVDLGSRTNLLQTLTDLGHPYGLLLGQSSGSSDSLLNFFFPPKKGEAKVFLNGKGNKEPSPMKTQGKFVFVSQVDPTGASHLNSNIIPGDWFAWSATSEEHSINSMWPFSKGLSLNSSYIVPSGRGSIAMTTREGQANLMRRIALFAEVFTTRASGNIGVSATSGKWEPGRDESDRTFEDYGLGMAATSLAKSSILSSAKSSPESARKIHMEELFNQQAFLAPIFLKLFAEEKQLSQRSRELHIGKNSVSLGTTAIKLTTYHGEQPFLVKTPQGEPLAQINPGDQLGHLHVSHQAGLMRNLSPLEKAEQITQDFMALFKAVESGAVNLDPKQQEVLQKAQPATLIGISHLVRLFRRKTGLPTWKLDVLPDLAQKFHQHDSQAVSTAFGGTRKVKQEDVEMMVVTPEMRQQLVANYA